MISYQKILLLGLFLIFTSCYQNYQEIILPLNSSSQFESLLLDSDYTLAVFLYENVKEETLLFKIFSEFALQNKDFIKSYAIDCSTIKNEPNRTDMDYLCLEYKESFPKIVFYQPYHFKFDPETGYKTKAKKYEYKGDMSIEDLTRFGQSIMPYFREILRSIADVERFANATFTSSKAIFFRKSTEIPPHFKALTSLFRDRLSVYLLITF